MSSLTVAATRSIEIDAPRAKVFGIVEEPGHLERFHPFCERNEVTAWADDDHRDSVLFYSGLLLDRVVVEWAAPDRIRLDAGRPGNPDPSRVHWDFEDTPDDRTRVAITIHRSAGGGVGPDILEPYLESALAGLKHFGETGTPVTKNQFGSNRVFSP